MNLKNRLTKLERQLMRTDNKPEPLYLRRVVPKTNEFIMGVFFINNKIYQSEPKESEQSFITRLDIKNCRKDDYEKIRHQMLDYDDC